MLKILILSLLNIGLIVLFVYLFRQRNLLSYHQGGRIWLTYLAVGVITLMDEFTSIFYAPAEAYRFIGLSAILFIAITSLLIRFISTRLTEIAEILEHHGLIGGGVYSFSYLVLGPMVSFVAVSSIMVDYILTACISAVSAVSNATSFFPLPQSTALILVLAIIWAVAGLNILGIRENARFTFMIFIGAAFVMLNLIVSGILNLDARFPGPDAPGGDSDPQPREHRLDSGGLRPLYLQHRLLYPGLLRGGIRPPDRRIGAELAGNPQGLLVSGPDRGHGDPLGGHPGLIGPHRFQGPRRGPDHPLRHHAQRRPLWHCGGGPGQLHPDHGGEYRLCGLQRTAWNGWPTATAFTGSSPPTGANPSTASICPAPSSSPSSFCSPWAARKQLANMYALGLLASFCINMGSLIIYRYFMGTGEGITYSTSRLGTLILWVILVSCFIFLAIDKPHATMLWAAVTGVMLLLGFLVAKKRSPEIKEIEQGDNEMEMILYLAESEEPGYSSLFPTISGNRTGPAQGE